MYKWNDEGKNSILSEDGMVIPKDPQSRHYQEIFASGEEIQPWKTEGELKKEGKDKEGKDLTDKFDADIATLLDPADFLKVMSRAIRLLRKEMHLVATPEEKAELNILEGIDLQMDALIEQYEVDKIKLKAEKEVIEEEIKADKEKKEKEKSNDSND